MPVFELSPQSGLYYEHHAPADAAGDTFSAGAWPVYVATDSIVLEHHDRAVSVDRGIGGRTGHYARQLSIFPQTRDRGLPGSDISESGPDSLAGSGNSCYLCICGRGSLLGVDPPTPNRLTRTLIKDMKFKAFSEIGGLIFRLLG